MAEGLWGGGGGAAQSRAPGMPPPPPPPLRDSFGFGSRSGPEGAGSRAAQGASAAAGAH